jgi:hypothetical protein
MNQDMINKIIASVLLTASLGTAVYFGAAHITEPTYVSVVGGTIVGFAAHALGVQSGAQTVQTGVQVAEKVTNGKTNGTTTTNPTSEGGSDH